MNKPVLGAILSATLGVGCGGEYAQLRANIPERRDPTLSNALAPITYSVTESADPAVDITLGKLFKKYGDKANRVAEYCLEVTATHDDKCPAVSGLPNGLQFWHIADINDSTDYVWGDTDAAGAKKCSAVLNTCLQNELITPTSLGATPIETKKSASGKPTDENPPEIPNISIAPTFNTLPIIFAVSDVLRNDPKKGPKKVENCLKQAERELPPDGRALYQSKSKEAGSNNMFWLYPINTTEGRSSGQYPLGDQNTKIFATTFKECLQ